MHHLSKIRFSKLENRPYHAECACGTAGDFSSNEEARNYLANHLTRLQGINSGDFVDETVAPVDPPAEEKPAESVTEESKTEQGEAVADAVEEDADDAKVGKKKKGR